MNGFRDKEGLLRLDSLFFETNKSDLVEIYTLESFKRNGLPSLHEIYMNAVNDYDFAIKAFNGSFEQFKKLCLQDWFMVGTDNFVGFAAWREEKKLKLDAELRYALEAAKSEGNIVAIKELNAMNNKVEDRGRGRPSDAEIEKKLNRDERYIEKVKKMKERLKMASNG